MKATGITRKIDELGRIVLPKELRKTLGIEPGTPIEIYTEDDMNRILDRLVNENLLLLGTNTDTNLATINILSQVSFKRKRGILSSSITTFKRFMKIRGMSFGKKLYVATLNTLKAIIVGSHSLARHMRKSAKKEKNGFQMFLEVQNEYEYSLIFEAFNELLLYEYIEEYGSEAETD